MNTLHRFEDGGYAFLEGGFPYSQGVVALPGFALERVQFDRPLPIAAGFLAIEAHLAALGRPRLALAGCELRSPLALPMEGFRAFNVGYRQVLESWGLIRNGLNPVGRSNLAPLFDAPAEPSFFAFSYTVPEQAQARVIGTSGYPDFVVAGSGEWPEGEPFPEAIVARGDLSAAGLASKVAFVLDTMDRRGRGLGVDITHVTATHVYTVHDVHALIGREFARRGLTRTGLTLFPCAPPILELEFEMDLRRVRSEKII